MPPPYAPTARVLWNAGEWAQSDPNVVERVIFIWNNPDHPPPQMPGNPNVPFVLVRPEVNVMINRFNVTSYLGSPAAAERSAVLMVDDDILMSRPLLSCMLRQWREAKTQMLGIDLRFVGYDSERGRTIYDTNPTPQLLGSKLTCRANINIGKTMLFSAKYLRAYMNDAKLVEKTRNSHCEDIAMNALILMMSGLPGKYAVGLSLRLLP